MASKAFAGVGTKFKRGDGASPTEVFTAIAEINSIDGPNKTAATIDVTSMDSTGGYREFISGFRDSGEITLEMNFTLDGYVDLNTDFEAGLLKNYQVVLSDAGNTTLEFAAVITALGLTTPMDDKVTSRVTLKISGPVTLSS